MKINTSLFTSAYGAFYIHKYHEDSTKNNVIDVKNLKSEAVDAMAYKLYLYIKSYLQSISSKNKYSILLLHAPSSTFISGKKSKDHMALVLECIHSIFETEKSHLKSSGDNLEQITNLDIATYTFFSVRPSKSAQHQKNKIQRIEGSKNNFAFIYPLPIALLQTYTQIYIIDDVLTTGSTLEALVHVIKKMHGQQKYSMPEIYRLAFCH